MWVNLALAFVIWKLISRSALSWYLRAIAISKLYNMSHFINFYHINSDYMSLEFHGEIK